MAQPFEIPEILCLICQYARRSDLVRLMTTSRLFFDCALPFVWHSLPAHAPTILMRLIPAGDEYLKDKSSAVVAEGLQPLDAQSLVRFNHYAPHVKRLVLFPSLQRAQGNAISDQLLALVNSRPLLPNLEVLGVTVAGHWTESGIASDAPRLVEPEVVHQLVTNIVQQCPRIDSLRLGDVTSHIISDPNWDPSGLAISLARLQNLRVLGLGLVTLNLRVLKAIGSLPNLKSLYLDVEGDSDTLQHSGEAPETLNASVKEPDESFPILRRLAIRSRDAYSFELVHRIWSIDVLVRRLTSISVHLSTSVDYTRIRDFVRILLRSSPLVNDLEFDLRKSWNCIGLLRTELINYLAQLPLRRLCLADRDDKHDSQRCSGQQLALAFPDVEDFQLSGRELTFEDLASIAAHMPKLERLSASIRMSLDWPSTDKITLLSLTPSPSRLQLRLPNSPSISNLSKSTSSSVIEKIAMGLHALWPNGVTCVSHKKSSKDSTKNLAERVNAMLMWLRESERRGN